MRFLLLAAVIAFFSGCSLLRSRYALDDPVYAEKYAVGASKSDWVGKIKQALDARHTEQLQGKLISGGAQFQTASDKTFGSADLGIENYITNYFTSRISIGGVVGDDKGVIGLDGGWRLQTPTRIAPFVGVGGGAGLLIQDAIPLAVDLISEDDQLIDIDRDDAESDVDGLAIVYPEVGVHFWFDGRLRLTTFGRYLITSEGRDFDNWLIGGQITLFGR